MKRVFCILTVAIVIAGLVAGGSMAKGKSTEKMMVDPAQVMMSKKATVNLSGQGFKPGEEVVILFTAVDGIGPDIWKATRMVLDAAVARACEGRRCIAWQEVLAGEKAFNTTGDWLPEAHSRRFAITMWPSRAR